MLATPLRGCERKAVHTALTRPRHPPVEQVKQRVLAAGFMTMERILDDFREAQGLGKTTHVVRVEVERGVEVGIREAWLTFEGVHCLELRACAFRRRLAA